VHGVAMQATSGPVVGVTVNGDVLPQGAGSATSVLQAACAVA